MRSSPLLNALRYASSSTSSHFYQNRVLEPYAQTSPSLVTLRQLVVFGRQITQERILTSANYVRSELPIRLAHRIRDFQQLPYVAVTNPRIAMAYDLYWQAFETMRQIKEIKTLNENDDFCKVLQRLLQEHLVVIPQLVVGIRECNDYISPQEADRFVMDCLRSRVSRRVLAEQHISLTHQLASSLNGRVEGTRIGVVETKLKAGQVLAKCVESARKSTLKEFDGSVEPKQISQVMVDGHLESEFMAIPKHVEYALHEVLYNAMRISLLRKAAASSSTQGESIMVTIAEGDTDLLFRVSDRAGGIPKGVEDPTHILGMDPQMRRGLGCPGSAQQGNMLQLEGVVGDMEGRHLGIGLLMARMYTEYWGGGVRWKSLAGWGTDVYVQMCKSGMRTENVQGECHIS